MPRSTFVAAMVALALAGCASKPSTVSDSGKGLCDEHVEFACGSNPAVTCINGACVCGPFELGLICPTGSVCTPTGDNRFACVSSLCDRVDCDRGMSCDPTNGQCTCAGTVCAPSQKCEQSVCTPPLCKEGECAFGQSCDPALGCVCGLATCADTQVCAEDKCVDADRCAEPFGVNCGVTGTCLQGKCVCGEGEPCDQTERCDAGSCVVNTCFGVNCPTGTKCNPDDGFCHCVGSDPTRPPTGPVCQSGGTCSDDGTCFDPQSCDNVKCGPGLICDNSDVDLGPVCRCGGVGPDYPQCAPDQSCEYFPRPHCSGTECVDNKCDMAHPGSSCDPEDGFCKCGGLGGQLCQNDDLCLGTASGPTCAARCDPLGHTCSGCYWDFRLGLAGCLPPGTAAEGAPCKELNDCAPNMACITAGVATTCVQVCPLDRAGTCPSGELCIRLDPASSSNLGQCIKL